jgi:hypothetical protein
MWIDTTSDTVHSRPMLQDLAVRASLDEDAPVGNGTYDDEGRVCALQPEALARSIAGSEAGMVENHPIQEEESV